MKLVENNNAKDTSEEDTLANVDSKKKNPESENDVAVQVTREKCKLKSAENASDPVIDEVADEFCSNDSYETKPKSSCSCGAAAVPERKLAGFDYLSMWPSD